MDKQTGQQKTVLESLLEWSLQRPLWQRDALRRIILKGTLEESDIQELTVLCKQESVGESGELQPIPLDDKHLPANPDTASSVSLLFVEDVSGVNNLAPTQTLAFDPNGLTVIYGDNGAGKSGYARILKRACHARHSAQIYPNIYSQDMNASPVASATIGYQIGGVQHPSQKWQDSNNSPPILSAVNVFDSDCASIHIDEKNEVAFRPFGLNVPDELASVCQRIKEALSTEQKQFEQARNPVFSKPLWKEDTAVGKAVSALKHDTDPDLLSKLATLPEADAARLTRLKEDLSKDPIKAAAEQRLKADNIKSLISVIDGIEAQTSSETLTKIFDGAHDAKLKRETARLAAENAFSGDPLSGVGGDFWRSLWDSARRYSEKVAYLEQPFPPIQKDSFCVLCQQPLQAEALDRMARFDEFIKEDTERKAQEAERISRESLRILLSSQISTRSIKSSLREVSIQNPDIAKRIRRFFASARARRFLLVKSLDNTAFPDLPISSKSPKVELEQFEKTIRDYALELQNSAKDDARKKLERDFAELSDRATLHGIIQIVLGEVQRLKSIHVLGQCIANTVTNAITKIGNDIADTIITPKMRDRFQEEIVKLAADRVRVEIFRSGGKFGSPHYKVRLFAKPDAKVGDILSEGEKTCVALAAFLTELATAAHHSTLVFDDPVSSLDHRWRTQVAKRLVAEADKRQIIVFTHDLVFVNDLNDIAQQEGRSIKLITVNRGAQGAGIVNDGLPWKAQSVENRIDKLEKDARAAKDLYENHEEEKYRHQAADIYNNLRASWERALEDIAFFRIVQRHRDYINTKDLKKAAVLNDSDCDSFLAGFKKCCDIVNAHDPSSGRNAEAPPPSEILQDIQALKDWVLSLRDRQKKVV